MVLQAWSWEIKTALIECLTDLRIVDFIAIFVNVY